MSPQIAVIGSLNIDLVVTMERMPAVGETVHGNQIHYLPGGKGANQAVGCSRLGANVLMIGAIGKDPFGEQVSRSLSDNGVKPDCVKSCDGISTGTATILQTKENNCIVVVPGANEYCSADLVLQYRDAIKSADVLLTQLEIPTDTVEYSLGLARESGVQTVLNPAPAKQLPKKLLQLADYLTPNETEFEVLSGCTFISDEELERIMKDWETVYRHKVVLTRGEKGCSYLQGDRLHTVPPLKVNVADTTGAGDAFNAAFSVAISKGWTMEDAIRFAVKASSLSVTKFGAQAGMPTLDEVGQISTQFDTDRG